MKITNPLKVNVDRNRIFGLDILRFIAIFAVIWGHASDILPKHYSAIHQSLFPVDGVTIFFVLSGFLIGSILLKVLEENPLNFKTLMNFWIRRWFRTLPAYYFVLILICIIHLRYDTGFKMDHAKYFFVFMQNFITFNVHFFGESWSLSIEEWFYLIVPVLIFISLGLKLFSKKHTIFIVSLFILVFITVYRYYKYLHAPPIDFQQWDIEYRRLVITRLDSLMYGVIGACLSMYYSHIWHKLKRLLPIGILMIIFLGFSKIAATTMFTAVYSFSLYSIATLMCLPYLSQLTSGKGAVYKIITHISLISYSMYLLNYTIIRDFIIKDFLMRHVIQHLPLSNTAIYIFNYITYWVLLFVLSALMYNYIELPAIRFRNTISSPKKLTLST